MRQQVSLASYLTFELFVNAGTYVDASQQLFRGRVLSANAIAVVSSAVPREQSAETRAPTPLMMTAEKETGTNRRGQASDR